MMLLDYKLRNSHFVLDFCPYLTVLSTYSWLYAQGTQGLETIWGIRDQIWVIHMQDKSCTYYTTSLAPYSIFFFPKNKIIFW